jgi:hypothetical protein
LSSGLTGLIDRNIDSFGVSSSSLNFCLVLLLPWNWDWPTFSVLWTYLSASLRRFLFMSLWQDAFCQIPRQCGDIRGGTGGRLALVVSEKNTLNAIGYPE